MNGSGEGARHVRSAPREPSSDAAARRRMLRLAIVPPALISLTGAAVITYLLRIEEPTGASPGTGTDSATVWGVVGGALLLACAVLVGAYLMGSGEARTVVERCTALRRSVVQHQAELHSLLLRLERGERIRAPEPVNPADRPSGDSVDLLAHELSQAQLAAETAVIEAAALVRGSASGNDEKVEVFVNLARRLQSLVHREIELLDELENDVEDPDLLKGLFHVDHLATRIRRHAENLAVLGGAVSRRQWSRPVTMTEVLRSSIAEVEHYPRVKLVPPIEGTLRGHAVADVIHLLAELVENASVFSAPQTQVLLRAQHVTSGLAVEVEDRGLGMTADEQSRMNAVLADPERIDVGELLQDGRIGLFVVSALARRHGIVVQLQGNIYGGTQAVLVLPPALLGDEPSSEGAVSLAARREQQSLLTQQAEPGPSASEPAPVHPEEPASSRSAHTPTSSPAPEQAVAAVPATAAEEPPSALTPRPPDPPPERPIRERPTHERARPEGQCDGRSGGKRSGPEPAGGEQTGGERPGERSEGERPQLPRRRRQEHLAAELREAPRGDVASDEPEPVHDPGLMAAFRRGTSLADDSDDSSR